MDSALPGAAGQRRIPLYRLTSQQRLAKRGLAPDKNRTMNNWNNGTCGNDRYLLSRRDMLSGLSAGFGYMAFAGMGTAQAATGTPLASKRPHFLPKAKRVIFCCMRGGPSHVDTFDHKPALARDEGKQLPKFRNRELMPSPWEFKQHGQGGLRISELFPKLAGHADDLCLLNGMHSSVPAHPQSFLQELSANA